MLTSDFDNALLKENPIHGDTSVLAGRMKGAIETAYPYHFRINAATGETMFVIAENGCLTCYKQKEKWNGIYKAFMHDVLYEDREAAAGLLAPASIKKMKAGEYHSIPFRLMRSQAETASAWQLAESFATMEGDVLTIYVFLRDFDNIVNRCLEMSKASDHDELTGLPNYVKLKEMIATQYQDLKSCGIIVFELANIAEIKRAAGHEGENAAIAQLVNSLRPLIRKDNELYRYSYDEFLFVDPDAKFGDASARIDMWRNQVKWMEENENFVCKVQFAKAWGRAPVSIDALIADAECQIYEYKEQDKMDAMEANAREVAHLAKRLTMVNNFFREEYGAIFAVNLDEDTYETLVENRKEEGNPFNSNLAGVYTDVVKNFIENLVTDEFKDMLEEAVSIEKLRKALTFEDRLEIEYQSSYALNGWRRITYQVVERHGNGVPKVLAMTNIEIDSSKAQRLLEQQAISEAYRMAEEASRAKTDFLSRMSHDIRTPMNAIVGMNAIAASHLDDREKVAECLEKIDGASKHLLNLINDILDLNRIEAGRQELVETNTSIVELIESVITMTRPNADAHQHAFEVIVYDIRNEIVMADANLLQRVMVNIIGNAIKYTPNGGYIKIEFYEQDIPGSKYGNYVFVCEDNGVGMTNEFLEEIYEPFSRSADTRTSKIQGTGLGMAITKNLVNLMDGTIGIESEVDEGTKVTIALPLLKVDTEPDYAPELKDKETLLLCNNVQSIEILTRLQEEMGLQVTVCKTAYSAARNAYEKLRHDDGYYAILVDGEIGGIDYITATKIIRQQIGFKIPIVLIDPMNGMVNETEVRAAGMTKSVSRPIFRSNLRECLKSLTGYQGKGMEGFTIEHHEDKAIFNPEIDFTGKNVLLVEDNELNAEIAIDIMQMTKANIMLARDGKEAVDIFTTNPENYFDIIFMDIQMPVMNGYQATVAIRNLPRMDAVRIPIIALTANAFSSDVQQARNAGMNEHLVKPIEFDKLENVMKKYLT